MQTFYLFIFKDLFISITCVYMFCLNARRCSMCVPRVHRGQKRALKPLQLELLLVEGYYLHSGK